MGDLLTSVSVPPIHSYCTRNLEEEGIGFPKIEAMDGFEVQYAYWESNLGSQEWLANA